LGHFELLLFPPLALVRFDALYERRQMCLVLPQNLFLIDCLIQI